MKIHILLASLGLALALPIPALAADNRQQSGHYEWQPVPQFGPRTSGPAQRRVLVSDQAQQAKCDCAMMKMHHLGSSKSDGSAS